MLATHNVCQSMNQNVKFNLERVEEKKQIKHQSYHQNYIEAFVSIGIIFSLSSDNINTQLHARQCYFMNGKYFNFKFKFKQCIENFKNTLNILQSALKWQHHIDASNAAISLLTSVQLLTLISFSSLVVVLFTFYVIQLLTVCCL